MSTSNFDSGVCSFGTGTGWDLVDRTGLDWVRWPLIGSTEMEQYLQAVVYVMPGQDAWFHALMGASHVDLTENHAAACR